MADEWSGKLLARWREGDEQAAAELFQRYADRLTALARSRLSSRVNRRIDPEDVVMSAYRSFFAGARAGRFEVERGGDLWRLLVVLTLHKLYRQVKHNARQKRALQRELPADANGWADLESQMFARQPSPLEAAALADHLEQIMSRLEPLQRRMLELRLQGFSLFEIAAQCQRTERTVRRLLDQVKQWLEEAV